MAAKKGSAARYADARARHGGLVRRGLRELPAPLMAWADWSRLFAAVDEAALPPPSPARWTEQARAPRLQLVGSPAAVHTTGHARNRRER